MLNPSENTSCTLVLMSAGAILAAMKIVTRVVMRSSATWKLSSAGSGMDTHGFH